LASAGKEAGIAGELFDDRRFSRGREFLPASSNRAENDEEVSGKKAGRNASSDII